MLYLYTICFPVGLALFLPGLIYKLIKRPGYKKTFAERFGIFSPERIKTLSAMKKPVWIHSVSVGETVIALSMLSKWMKMYPERQFVISTTTTTGQELARSKAPAGVEVIFCPIDFLPFVMKTFSIVKPSALVIFETEIWPCMVNYAASGGIGVFLVNGRMSDKSVKGYRRFSFFFRPLLEKFRKICVQTAEDEKRFKSVAPGASLAVCGNMKFDQEKPSKLPDIDLKGIFGEGKLRYLLGASTHPGEEKLIISVYKNLKNKYADLKLVLVPRHAERGGEIEEELKTSGLSWLRRSRSKTSEKPVDCLLADTTGEMMGFIDIASVVIMGKSLAGQDEGHNLIEPALMSKAIVTGAVLRNFRQVLEVLKSADALVTVASDPELEPALDRLFAEPDLCRTLGEKAAAALTVHRGAIEKSIKILEESL